MFLVGATGQLLTLILTVCLPFIFLLSGSSKSDLSGRTKLVEVHQNKLIEDSHDKTKIDYSNFVGEVNNPVLIAPKYSLPLKLPLTTRHILISKDFPNSSANKAPPSDTHLIS